MNISPTINSVHGRIFVLTPGNPAAGENLIITVPDRRRWRVLTIRFLFTTDATVANRYIGLNIKDNSLVITGVVGETAQTASLAWTHNYSLQPVKQFQYATISQSPLPPLTLIAGHVIRTSIDSLQAADQISDSILLIEEWIDP